MIYTQKSVTLHYHLKYSDMALEIKSPPVLEGKAAREFYKKVAEAKESKSKEEVQESYRKWRAFFAKQKVFDYYD